jgi:hypothetical protein
VPPASPASLIARATRSTNWAAARSVPRCIDWRCSTSKAEASADNGDESARTMTLGIRSSFQDLAVARRTGIRRAERLPLGAFGEGWEHLPERMEEGTSGTATTFEHAVPRRRYAAQRALRCIYVSWARA